MKQLLKDKSRIKCSECEQVKAVRPEVFDKRVEKFGSEEKLRAEYLCRECRGKRRRNKEKEYNYKKGVQPHRNINICGICRVRFPADSYKIQFCDKHQKAYIRWLGVRFDMVEEYSKQQEFIWFMEGKNENELERQHR